MRFQGRVNDYFEIIDIINTEQFTENRKNEFLLLWFLSAKNEVLIDTEQKIFTKNEIICLADTRKLIAKSIPKAKLIRWNPAFYCVVGNDTEVKSKGVLYYNPVNIPSIKLNGEDLIIFSGAIRALERELNQSDDLQPDLLKLMLRRLLLLFTRIYRTQVNLPAGFELDVIREFYYLVEMNFKRLHRVKEYAGKLNKSPKTLSHILKQNGNTSPRQIIQDRILLEAQKLLIHSGSGISEIGYDLGFSSVQSFSRFFRSKTGLAPHHYREQEVLTSF